MVQLSFHRVWRPYFDCCSTERIHSFGQVAPEHISPGHFHHSWFVAFTREVSLFDPFANLRLGAHHKLRSMMSILVQRVHIQRVELVHQGLLQSAHFISEPLHLFLWNAPRQWTEAILVRRDQDVKDARRLLFAVLELLHAELRRLVVLPRLFPDAEAHLAEDNIKASLAARLLQIGDHVLQRVVALKDCVGEGRRDEHPDDALASDFAHFFHVPRNGRPVLRFVSRILWRILASQPRLPLWALLSKLFPELAAHDALR